MRFENKVAIVTGGAGLIGGAVARRLASEGAKVCVSDINSEAIDRVVADIQAAGGEAFGFVCNLRVSAEVEACVAKTTEKYGRLDILVSSAGGSARSTMANLIDQTDEVIENIIGVNLFGAIWFARAAGRKMAEQKYGRIITVSSIVGNMGNYRQVEYAASKGGVVSMTKSLAKELGGSGVTVNCVSPGIVPHDSKDYSETNYLGRNCSAEDISNVVCFLASDEASFVTGQDYAVDGGRSLALRGSF